MIHFYDILSKIKNKRLFFKLEMFKSLDQFKDICKYLTYNQTITDLCVWNYDKNENISNEIAIRLLSSVLELNNTISIFEYTNFHENSLDAFSIEIFMNSLEKNQSIVELIIAFRHTKIDQERSIYSLLQNKPRLKKLKLTFEIGIPGIQQLALSLEHNKNISIITLSFCKLNNETAKILATSLEVNHGITYLDLGFNSIGNEGVSAIASALRKNETLEFLSLSSNKFDNNGVKSLADSLKENRTLTKLWLFNNSLIDGNMFFYLADFLEHNQTLSEFGTHTEGQGYESVKKFYNLLERNQKKQTRKSIQHIFHPLFYSYDGVRKLIYAYADCSETENNKVQSELLDHISTKNNKNTF